MLVDSPVIAGEYLRVVPLSENPRQEMDIAADSPADLDAPQDELDHYKALTDQALKLFGAQHFRDYHFIYSLSDHVAHFGLEHHESNDSRSSERSLVDADPRLLSIWIALARICSFLERKVPPAGRPGNPGL